MAGAGALAPRATPIAHVAHPRLTLDRVLVAGSALVIAYLVLSPIAFLVISSFRRYQLEGSIAFVFTLENYREVLLNPEFPAAAGNSLAYALGGTVLAVAIGTALAWIVERTNTPLRGTFMLLAAATYFVPGILIAIAWNALANDRIGSLHRLLQNDTDDW